MSYFARGDQLADWTISRRIGRGGMGLVYAAVHSVIGKRVAVKVIRSELRNEPALVDRFVHEARVVNRLAHPAIVDIFHIGWLDDGRVYLVMEFLMGRSLAQRLRDGAISTAEGVSILAQLTEPLACAHAHGVVHRDVKPDNVFLVDDGTGEQVKLLDWGLSVSVDDPPAGTLVGTPRYLAPEQARGERVDARTDVYALGVLGYELLLGRAPFSQTELPDLVRAHLHEAPPRPRALWPEIPTALDELLFAMLAKAPAERPGLATVQATLAGCASALPLPERSMLASALSVDWDLPTLSAVAAAAAG